MNNPVGRVANPNGASISTYTSAGQSEKITSVSKLVVEVGENVAVVVKQSPGQRFVGKSGNSKLVVCAQSICVPNMQIPRVMILNLFID